jgi:formyl-CoA transferase
MSSDKALSGIRILDMTHVQAGPTSSQLMGFLGADVIKVESPRGDATRGQLRDIPDADSLYFTMLNCNKRGMTLNLKNDKGKEIFTKLIETCDVIMENFGPGVLDRLGFSWEEIHKINPRIVMASIKGFGTEGPYAAFKAYENVAQAMGGSLSTTGLHDGPPVATGAQIGDSGTGVHLMAGILAALLHRERTGKGQYVECAMMDCVMNLCRVKWRDHQRLDHGPLTEYAVQEFEDFTPRAGNDSGGGQLGNAIQCKCPRQPGWRRRPRQRRALRQHHCQAGEPGRDVEPSDRVRQSSHEARAHGDSERDQRALRADHGHERPRQRRTRHAA